jgi:hypothetical protein
MAPRRFGRLDPAHVLSLAGVAAAMFVAVMVNVLGARHWKRWDWTTGKLYTLSPATLTTLHDLPDTVEIWVLLGSADPMANTVKQLLSSYSSETNKLDIHYVDPDRDAVALVDVRRRFHIEAGKTEDGHVVTDATIVVARGDRHWFLAPADMVEILPGEETREEARAKPKEEQAITGAIRNVLAGDKARICFTSGHGELSLADGSAQGLGFLKDVLEKDNYEVTTVDTTEANAFEPFKGCALVVVAGPRGPLGKEEEGRLKTYLMTGGNLLACVSPITGAGATGLDPPGLAEALAPFGIGLDEDVVLEKDPKLKIPGQRTAFFVGAKAHAVSSALVEEGTQKPPKIIVGLGIADPRALTRSMHVVSPPGAAPATDVLVTSRSAFGLASVVGADSWPEDGPPSSPTDVPGPLVLAMASERPKLSPSAPHGPRVVVIGGASVLLEHNWREPAPVHGAAYLVENAISWLTARPAILDVPAKPAVAAGLRISDESRDELRRYVLIYMPLAAALLGLAVGLRRRSTEGRKPAARGGKTKRPSPDEPAPRSGT